MHWNAISVCYCTWLLRACAGDREAVYDVFDDSHPSDEGVADQLRPFAALLAVVNPTIAFQLGNVGNRAMMRPRFDMRAVLAPRMDVPEPDGDNDGEVLEVGESLDPVECEKILASLKPEPLENLDVDERIEKFMKGQKIEDVQEKRQKMLQEICARSLKRFGKDEDRVNSGDKDDIAEMRRLGKQRVEGLEEDELKTMPVDEEAEKMISASKDAEVNEFELEINPTGLESLDVGGAYAFLGLPINATMEDVRNRGEFLRKEENFLNDKDAMTPLSPGWRQFRESEQLVKNYIREQQRMIDAVLNPVRQAGKYFGMPSERHFRSVISMLGGLMIASLYAPTIAGSCTSLSTLGTLGLIYDRDKKPIPRGHPRGKFRKKQMALSVALVAIPFYVLSPFLTKLAMTQVVNYGFKTPKWLEPLVSYQFKSLFYIPSALFCKTAWIQEQEIGTYQQRRKFNNLMSSINRFIKAVQKAIF